MATEPTKAGKPERVIERFEYSDDPRDVLEVTASSAVGGPDAQGGLHFGTSYNYARLPGGSWSKTDGGHRSRHTIRAKAMDSPSAAEAFRALTHCESGTPDEDDIAREVAALPKDLAPNLTPASRCIGFGGDSAVRHPGGQQGGLTKR